MQFVFDMVGKPQSEMSEAPKKVDLGLLEEDDEFEEFPAEGKFLNEYQIKFTLCDDFLKIICCRIKIEI